MHEPDHPHPPRRADHHDPRPRRLPDFYAILGVAPDAPTAQIDQTIRQQLRQWQRRAATSADLARRQQAERRVELLGQARAVLLDDQARARYDQQPTRARPGQAPDATAGQAATWPSATSQPAAPMSTGPTPAAPGPVPAEHRSRRPVIVGAVGVALVTIGAAAQPFADHTAVAAVVAIIVALVFLGLAALTPDVYPHPRRRRHDPDEGDLP